MALKFLHYKEETNSCKTKKKALNESTRRRVRVSTPKTLSSVIVYLLRRRCAPPSASPSLFTVVLCRIFILALTSADVVSRPQHR
ncbi:hypothetical protein QVD17_03893 [Tagetes erecta]|uniref:Uncharacterized protein n=1 Tax=Tagetes erecta TaxID=13708 RepID=A0AAD8P3T1_TARER|nr:hypothetical protein QVD17_03893 [Tagetes erecta]